MGDCTKADHVELVLVAHQEVVGRETGVEAESARLFQLDLAVRLQDHTEWVVDLQELLTLAGELLSPMGDGLRALLVAGLELHLHQS